MQLQFFCDRTQVSYNRKETGTQRSIKFNTVLRFDVINESAWMTCFPLDSVEQWKSQHLSGNNWELKKLSKFHKILNLQRTASRQKKSGSVLWPQADICWDDLEDNIRLLQEDMTHLDQTWQGSFCSLTNIWHNNCDYRLLNKCHNAKLPWKSSRLKAITKSEGLPECVAVLKGSYSR